MLFFLLHFGYSIRETGRGRRGSARSPTQAIDSALVMLLRTAHPHVPAWTVSTNQQSGQGRLEFRGGVGGCGHLKHYRHCRQSSGLGGLCSRAEQSRMRRGPGWLARQANLAGFCVSPRSTSASGAIAVLHVPKPGALSDHLVAHPTGPPVALGQRRAPRHLCATECAGQSALCRLSSHPSHPTQVSAMAVARGSLRGSVQSN